MQNQHNPLASASLVCGVLAFVLLFVGYCVGIIPIIGMVAILLVPIEWLLAFAGLITGVMGYRTADALEGTGRGAAIGGLGLSLAFFAFQALLFTLVCFGVGGILFLDAVS